MRRIRLSDRVLVVAPPGGGKSVLVQYIVSRLQPCRVCVVDPKEDPPLLEQLRGIEIVRDVELLPEALRAPVTHWVPEDPDNLKELNDGYSRIWNTPGPLILWDDEVADVTGPSRICRAQARYIKRGRAHDKCWVGATQRLTETHPTCRTQAEHLIAMTPAPQDMDLDTLARYMNLSSAALRDELTELWQQAGDYSHIWCVVTAGHERRCMAPCPPPPYRWPRNVLGTRREGPAAAPEAASGDAGAPDPSGEVVGASSSDSGALGSPA